MISDLFLYFAKFPKRKGVTAMFTNGQSDFTDYQALLTALDEMEGEPLLPDIDNYIYGQDFDELKSRVEKIFGSWLFADYGEFTFSEDRTPGSLKCQQQLAVTVAMKLSDRADMVERMIANDKTLGWVNTIYARHALALTHACDRCSDRALRGLRTEKLGLDADHQCRRCRHPWHQYPEEVLSK